MQQNIKSRHGNYYSLLGIKQILQNPVYCIADKEALQYFQAQDADVCFDEAECWDKLGLLAYNKRDYKKKHAPRQSMDKWIIAIGKHKGRISGAKWVAVQNAIEDNIPTGDKPAKIHNDYSLLSGLITCGHCASRMFAKQRTERAANHSLYDYICSNKLRGGISICQCQNLNGRQTDDLVCEYLMAYMETDSDVYRLMEQLKRDLEKQVEADPTDAIAARIRKANSELDNLVHMLAQDRITGIRADRVSARAAELNRELAELSKEKARLKAEASSASDRTLEIDMLTSVLASLQTYFPQLSVYEKRTLIRLIVQKIEWDGKELHIFLYGG